MACALVHLPAVDDAERGEAQRLAAEEDVLGHREVGRERKLLVDHRDAVRDGVRRPREACGLAFNQNLARVRLVHAGEYLHQR